MTIHVQTEPTKLAARLWESLDPAAYELAADEAEAAARWSDRVVADYQKAGNVAGACYEMRKAHKDRVRARHLRDTARLLRTKAARP